MSLLRMDPGLDSTAYGGDGSISGGAGGCFPDQIPSICVAMLRLFLMLVTVVLRALRATGRSRSELVLESIALRQQIGVLKQKRSRPPLDDACRAFWVAMRVPWRGSVLPDM